MAAAPALCSFLVILLRCLACILNYRSSKRRNGLQGIKQMATKKYFYVKNNIGQAKKISVCLTCLSQWSLVPGHPFTVRIKVYMTGLQSSWFCTQAPTTQSRLSFSQSVITLYLDVNVLRLYKLAYIFGHMLFIWFVK